MEGEEGEGEIRGGEGEGKGGEGRGRHGFWGMDTPGKEEGEGEGERRIGEDPQCLKCVDANVHVHNYM